jgi:hypothetical protein
MDVIDGHAHRADNEWGTLVDISLVDIQIETRAAQNSSLSVMATSARSWRIHHGFASQERELTVAQTLVPPVPAAQLPDRRVRPWAAVVWTVWLPVLLITFGAAARIRQYVFNRSLWIDEAMIAGNIANRSYAMLLRPLADHQGAPIGWLWLERTVVLVFGSGERALRLVPLLAGIAVLPVSFQVARRLLPRWLVPVVVAFAAVSPFLVRYSNEAKQYETDVLIGLVLLWVSLPLVDAPLQRHPLVIWSAAAALAVWLSHPAIFFVAGFAGVLLVVRLARRELGALAALAAACLPCAAGVLANSYWFLGRIADDDTLLRYFARGFPPRAASAVAMTAWVGDRWQAFVRAPLGLRGPAAVVAVLAVAGLAAMTRGGRVRGLLVVAPVPLFLVAAVLRVYPLEGRLVLALVPLVLLAVVAAADWGWRRGVVATTAGLVALGALLTPIATGAVAGGLHPHGREEVRGVLEAVRQQLQPGDRILVEDGARPAFTYHAARLGLETGASVVRLTRDAPTCDDRGAVARLAGWRRVWTVFSHHLLATPRDNQARIRARLLAYGPRVASIVRQGARADLYDPAARSSTPVAPPAARAGDCLRLEPVPAQGEG